MEHLGVRDCLDYGQMKKEIIHWTEVFIQTNYRVKQLPPNKSKKLKNSKKAKKEKKNDDIITAAEGKDNSSAKLKTVEKLLVEAMKQHEKEEKGKSEVVFQTKQEKDLRMMNNYQIMNEKDESK